MAIPSIPVVCDPSGSTDPEQLIRMANLSADKIEQAIGQLSSSVIAFAKGLAVTADLNSNVDFGGWLNNELSSCPDLFGLKQCLEGLLGDLDFGVDIGASIGLQAPCFNADIQDFINFQFSCAKKATESLADQGIDDPIGTGRREQLEVPDLAKVTNARFSRQDEKVLIEWSDSLNPTGTIYTVQVFGIRLTATTSKEFLLPGLTQGRSTDVVIKANDTTMRFQSDPVTLEVTAFDFRQPSDPISVETVGVSLLEAILSWVSAIFPNIIGYNIRWEDTDGDERVYWTGNRGTISLGFGDLLPAGRPTLVRVSTVTQWDESDGLSILVTPEAFAVDGAPVFDPPGNPGVGVGQTFAVTTNHDLAPIGGWYVGLLKGIGQPDIVIPFDPDMVAVGNVFTASYLRPSALYTDIEVKLWSRAGETITVTEMLPL